MQVLASEAVIKHLQSLNVTAIELLPIHQSLSDRYLVDRDLVNYWATTLLTSLRRTTPTSPRTITSSIARIQNDGPIDAHRGIEVILDVVYNHTAEGNQNGPLSRGEASTMLPTTGFQKIAVTTLTLRLRQYIKYAASESPSNDYGLAAVLRDRDAR